MQKSATYASFLLRFWQLQAGERPIWVASILRMSSGEQRSFMSVEALVEFLQTEYGMCSAAAIDATGASQTIGKQVISVRRIP